MKRLIILMAVVALAGAAPHSIQIMFSDGYRQEFQTRSLTFTVGTAFFRVSWDRCTPCICQAPDGMFYEAMVLKFTDRDPASRVVFGCPEHNRRKGCILTFGSGIQNGEPQDPETFRITTVGSNFVQAVPHEEQ
jgi:hypothetical protein